MAGEMEVDGNLNVTDTLIVNNRDVITTIDSLQQQISSLLVLIAQLEQRIAQLECQNIGNIPAGYCDCFGNTLDSCGICGGDAESEEDCPICLGLTEVELWGVSYPIDTPQIILHGSDDLIGELTGSIPPEIGCLTNLTQLHLHYNQLSGSIPPEIGNLTNLINLGLHNNQLTGSIPPEIGNLTNLTYLYLIDNQLSGDIPPEVCDLIESNNLNINHTLVGNNLTNTCEEPSICDGLTEVELWGVWYDIESTTEIDFYNQELTGSIPSEIGCLTNLTALSLHTNQLTGEIPSEIGNLMNLSELNLQDNQLTGEIPVEIGNLTNLTNLRLYNNQLTGEIPSEIGQLTNLTYLYLYNNQLTGEIPPEVCDLIENNNLDMLDILDGNNIINTCE